MENSAKPYGGAVPRSGRHHCRKLPLSLTRLAAFGVLETLGSIQRALRAFLP
jgi:hypothetical protein